MQNKVKIFNESMPCDKTPMPCSARLLDIISELGELGKEYLKATKYGAQQIELNEDFTLEFGDVLYSLLSLANEMNIDANDALDKVLTKYQNRINSNGNLGSGR